MHTYSHGTVVIVIDCENLDRSADFWSAVLDYTRPHPRSDNYLILIPPKGGIEILLQQVPEPKQVKNRIHLDLRTPDLTAEVTRICQLGATQLTEQPFNENDWTWHLLGDPDGNEFCVLQPPNDFPWPSPTV